MQQLYKYRLKKDRNVIRKIGSKGHEYFKGNLFAQN